MRSVDAFLYVGGVTLVGLVVTFVVAQHRANLPSPVQAAPLPVEPAPPLVHVAAEGLPAVHHVKLPANIRCVGGVVIQVSGNSYSSVVGPYGPVRCANGDAPRR